MTKESIKKLSLFSNFKEFCEKQVNCIECTLRKEDLITQGYDQPCEEVYGLLKIIQES